MLLWAEQLCKRQLLLFSNQIRYDVSQFTHDLPHLGPKTIASRSHKDNRNKLEKLNVITVMRICLSYEID